MFGRKINYNNMYNSTFAVGKRRESNNKLLKQVIFHTIFLRLINWLVSKRNGDRRWISEVFRLWKGKTLIENLKQF